MHLSGSYWCPFFPSLDIDILQSNLRSFVPLSGKSWSKTFPKGTAWLTTWSPARPTPSGWSATWQTDRTRASPACLRSLSSFLSETSPLYLPAALAPWPAPSEAKTLSSRRGAPPATSWTRAGSGTSRDSTLNWKNWAGDVSPWSGGASKSWAETRWPWSSWIGENRREKTLRRSMRSWPGWTRSTRISWRRKDSFWLPPAMPSWLACKFEATETRKHSSVLILYIFSPISV